MPAGSFAENQTLAYLLLGGTATRNTSWSVGLCTGSPTQAALSEFAGGAYARQAVVFSSSNAGTFTNHAAITFGTPGTTATMSGIIVVNGAGSLLLYGVLATATSMHSTSSGTIGSGALSVALS